MTTDHTSPVNPRLTPRPTTYSGVKMRSRLEAAWAEQFDAFGWDWEYEPECFAAAAAGQYLPDFRVTIPGSNADPLYVEVKPHYWITPEHWGFKGFTEDTHGETWNPAVKALDDEIYRMAGAISANAPMAMFVVCSSADEDGQCWITAAMEIDPQQRTWPLTPVRCGHGCVSLAHDPTLAGCNRHRWTDNQWYALEPIDSLYAPKGFGNYEAARRRPDDRADFLLRGQPN